MNSNNNVAASSPNEGDFSTLQMMFQTNNYAATSNNSQLNQPFEMKAPVADSSKASTGGMFATMGGGASANFDFNMASFGTMQMNNSCSNAEVDRNLP